MRPTGDDTDATIVLEDPQTGGPFLYTGNEMDKRGEGDNAATHGPVTIQKINALTGEQVWQYQVDARLQQGGQRRPDGHPGARHRRGVRPGVLQHRQDRLRQAGQPGGPRQEDRRGGVEPHAAALRLEFAGAAHRQGRPHLRRRRRLRRRCCTCSTRTPARTSPPCSCRRTSRPPRPSTATCWWSAPTPRSCTASASAERTRASLPRRKVAGRVAGEREQHQHADGEG